MKDGQIETGLLRNQSFFLSPDYLEISAWTEHIPFAFWIVEVLKPKTIVELGVHTGTSYFSFCQAVKRFDTNTVCYGIDTWHGDEHAGFYEEEIFAKVSAHNSLNYSRFSTLVRTTFDEANAYFTDGTIDLLHIDGLHTYEAVKHDFEVWLPKLSSNALVLFHDINVRERNFGVFKFWEELKKQYRNFQFNFGHGLGVLAMGDAVPQLLSLLLQPQPDESYYGFLRNLFSERGSFFHARMSFDIHLNSEREKAEAQHHAYAQLAQTHANLEEQQAQLHQTVATLTASNEQLQHRLEAFTASDVQLQSLVKELESFNNSINEENKLLAARTGSLEDEIRRLTEAIHVRSTKYKALKLKYQALRSAVRKLKERYKNDTAQISKELGLAAFSSASLFDMLAKQKEAIIGLNKQVATQQKTISWYQDTYEFRSLLGILKEKLRPKSEKKVAPADKQPTITANTPSAVIPQEIL